MQKLQVNIPSPPVKIEKEKKLTGERGEEKGERKVPGKIVVKCKKDK